MIELTDKAGNKYIGIEGEREWSHFWEGLPRGRTIDMSTPPAKLGFAVTFNENNIPCVYLYGTPEALEELATIGITCPPACTDETGSEAAGQSPTGPKTRTAN